VQEDLATLVVQRHIPVPASAAIGRPLSPLIAVVTARQKREVRVSPPRPFASDSLHARRDHMRPVAPASPTPGSVPSRFIPLICGRTERR